MRRQSVSDQWTILAEHVSASRDADNSSTEFPVAAAKLPHEQSHDSSVIESDSRSEVKLASKSSGRRSFAYMLIAAVAVCLLFAMLPFIRSVDDQRFFARASVLESDLTGREDLQMVAETVSADWNSQLTDRDEIRAQLVALRDSCVVLIADDINQIRPAIAADFKTRCQNWQT